MRDDLIQAIEQGSAVFVVGTGLSISASGGALTASWMGLLEDGINHLANVEARDDTWISTVRALLKAGSDANQIEFLVHAATSIGDAIRDVGGVAYATWLSRTVGSLPLADPSLPLALCNLPVPILTTNYDDLLERASGRSSATWLQPGEMQKVLAARSTSVGHLHGLWNVPESVILTGGDYRELIASPAAQAIQRSFATVKSVIYVGVGGGLSDPNFERFLAWHRDTFPNPGLQSFRLCTDSELHELTVQHRSDAIELISYGDHHRELVPYLSQIRDDLGHLTTSDVGLVVDPIGDARALFRDEMRAEMITAQDDEASVELPLDSLVLEPILLAVPHAQYVSEKMTAKGSEPLARLDPSADFDTNDVILLAGEEHSGLSFAAKWLALKISERRPLLVPLSVDFTGFGRVKPLTEATRRQARAAGLALDKKAPLPSLALVVDDYSPYSPVISERVIVDLAGLAPGVTIFTCRQGSEDDVKKKLEDSGHTVRLRYVGKLEPSDIALLARIVAPSDSERLTRSVLSLLRSEHLPRTPYTVSQLLFIMFKGGSLGANASSTSVLEEYVALLLGRGDVADDSRYGLDYKQREAILERLAERFVADDRVGMSDAATTSAIEEILTELSWPEAPLDVVQDFLNRRVLARRKGYIAFARSSFLHLFAAKQAQKSDDFKDKLLERPLYYTSAIGHYASLNRHDTTLLDKMKDLLEAIEWSATGDIFEVLPLVEPDFAELVLNAENAGEDEARGVTSEIEPEPQLHDLTDEDPPPFPVANEEDIPRAQVRMRVVDLASRVVRDADEAGSPGQKSALLGLLLNGWGEVMTELGADPTFQSLITEIASTLIPGAGEESAVDLENSLLKNLTKIVPALIAFAGIAESLSSRKLVIAMDHLIEEGVAARDVETAAASIFFLMAVDEREWPAKVRRILAEQPNSWVIRDFILFMLFGAYQVNQRKDMDHELLESCVEIIARATKYKDDRERQRHASTIRANFKAVRDQERLREKAEAAIDRARLTS